MKAFSRSARTTPGVEVAQATVGVDELAGAGSGDPDGHRVDGEITPRQIVEQAARLDDWQRTRAGIALPAGGDEIDVSVGVRQLDHRRPEARMGRHRRAEAVPDGLRQRDRIALDDQVEIVQMLAPEQGVADHAADDADLPRQVRPKPHQHRVSQELVCEMSTIHVVSWDPLSEKLIENSPLRNPQLVDAFSRYEQLTITELDAAWDTVNEAFRDWVEQPRERRPPHPAGPTVLGPDRDRLPARTPHLVGVT